MNCWGENERKTWSRGFLTHSLFLYIALSSKLFLLLINSSQQRRKERKQSVIERIILNIQSTSDSWVLCFLILCLRGALRWRFCNWEINYTAFWFAEMVCGELLNVVSNISLAFFWISGLFVLAVKLTLCWTCKDRNKQFPESQTRTKF